MKQTVSQLVILIRKMYRNGWLTACLLLGSILIVTMISTIPIYTGGVLQRLLTKDLESFQKSGGVYPGTCSVKYNFYTILPEKIAGKPLLFNEFHNLIDGELMPSIGLPTVERTRRLSLYGLRLYPADRPESEEEKRFARVETLQDLENHIEIIQGRVFRSSGQDGVFEAVVTEEALQRLDLVLGKEYNVLDKLLSGEDVFKVRIVGVFTIQDPRDPFWFSNLSIFSESVLLEHGEFTNAFVQRGFPNFTYAQWYYALDYRAITLRNVDRVLTSLQAIQQEADRMEVEWLFPAVSVLERYEERADTLRTNLLFLQIPVLLMLSLFIYMSSRMVIEHDRNEIALLSSRGITGSQVFRLYLTESLMLGAVSVLSGPPMGLLFCRVLGSANGFLEFIQRTAMPFTLTLKTYLYALGGAALFVLTMMLPVLGSMRTSIVEYKAAMTRPKRSPLWKRFFLDLILIAVSGYGFYGYRVQQKILILTRIRGGDLPIDPLLFVISVLFIVGSSLLFIRLFPSIVRFIFWTGRKIWSPVFYAVFTQVSRSMGHEQFLMMFLILSLSLGVFNSITARTLNRNGEEKIRYANGADMVIQPVWPVLSGQGQTTPTDPTAQPEAAGNDAASSGDEIVVYSEPPFTSYQTIEGIEVAAKVYRNAVSELRVPDGKQAEVQLMGIIPAQFGRVAWFRSDLLPSHWYEYLNRLARDPKAFLLSTSLRNKYGIRVGDTVYVTWARQMYLDGYVAAFIDFWPSYNPYGVSTGGSNDLVVANLGYIHAKMLLEPYQIWLKKQPGATSGEIYASMDQKELAIEKLWDASQLIIARKNDPMLQGTNGVLTLQFIISMSIALFGFFIFWFLSLKKRTFHLGVLRAIGISKRKVIGMLVFEQLMISGAAVISGMLIGYLVSYLFVPLLQITSSAVEQVPPFLISISRKDFAKIYLFVGATLALGVILFQILISRIRIHQAIKLGED